MSGPIVASAPAAILELLKARGITSIVIVDDAFDPPSRKNIETKALDEFWAAVEQNDTATKELDQILGEVKDFAALTDAHLVQLLEGLDQLTALQEPCAQLFGDIVGKRKQIDRFAKPLADLKLKIVALGTADEFTIPDAKLVFLDYFLGAKNNEEARDAAIARAKDIYSRSKNGKPLIVLMSSIKEVAQEKENFRKASGLLGGMFDFVAKADLAITEKLLVRIDFWLMGFPIGYELQHFVDTIDASISGVTKAFLERVRELNLNDYAYIQMLSLQADGNPLGEYMLWLYQSVFGHLLFEANNPLRAEMRALDSMRFEDFLPTQAIPSEQLSEMYMVALFDTTVGDLTAHPQDVGANALNARPYLQIGDVFIKDVTQELRMVINAQCDLAIAPHGDRPCDPRASILLIAGELVPLDQPVPKANVLRTELFKYEGKSYRIAWYLERVRSVPRAELSGQFAKEGYKRRARLRLPFALEVQQAFSANLTRVGLPVAPPIYQLIQIQIFGRQPDGSFAAIHKPLADAGFIAPYRGPKSVEERLVLTAGFVDTLLSQAVTLSQQFEAEATNAQGNEKTKLKQSAQLLGQASQDFELRRKLLKPCKLPDLSGGKGALLQEKLLTVRWFKAGDVPADVRELIVIAIDPVLPPEEIAVSAATN